MAPVPVNTYVIAVPAVTYAAPAPVVEYAALAPSDGVRGALMTTVTAIATVVTQPMAMFFFFFANGVAYDAHCAAHFVMEVFLLLSGESQCVL